MVERRARVEERGQAKMDIKGGLECWCGAVWYHRRCGPASHLQWPIRDLLGWLLWLHAHTPHTNVTFYPVAMVTTHCVEQLRSCLSHKYTHTRAALPGSSLRALQLLMWCLQSWCCYGCAFNKHREGRSVHEDGQARTHHMMVLLKKAGESWQ